jgi:hypothetical protein
VASNAGAGIEVLDNQISHNSTGFASNSYAGATSANPTVIMGNQIIDNTYAYPGDSYNNGVLAYGNYIVVKNNLIQNNGNPTVDSIAVHIDNSSGQSYGENDTVAYNLISGEVSNTGDGGGVEVDNYTSSNAVYGNVIYGNYGPCLDIYEATNLNLYNNSCYGNLLNASFVGYHAELSISDSTDDIAMTVNARNNILFATQPDFAVYVDTNSASKTVAITNNLLYGSGQSNWWYWSGSSGKSVTTFNAFAGVNANLNSNPEYTSTSIPMLTLQFGSPAIGAGANLGSYYNSLLPASTWPAGVLTGMQHSAWDIGAYLAPGSKPTQLFHGAEVGQREQFTAE